MLKNGYKIILIKEGKYNLKQFNISFSQILLAFSLLIILAVTLISLFSENISNYSDNYEIENHRINNQNLIKNIEDNQKQINSFLDQLESIKKKDEVLRKLVKLPAIHDDIRKMGYGGLDENKKSNEYNYLLPPNNVDLDSLNNKIDFIHRLIKLELLSYS
ncbi:uncharacterized protein METZ01_LOCUS481742, partial [marine metagenome]